MLQLGIIGLGDIARKAYLPVLGGQDEVAVHLYTRNEAKLTQVGQQYRFQNLHHSLDALLQSGIKGAFVHAATESHFELVEKLLSHRIHVFIDKPLTYDYASAARLVDLAEQNNLTLMVGFNRRYAPAYQQLKELQEPNMVLMQKNRKSLPGDVRTFVFDDFIHVVDTLRYLFPYPIEQLLVNGRKEGDQLYHVVVQLVARQATAIGIMNRDSGTGEERLEVMSPTEKRVVQQVSELSVLQDKKETRVGMGDWSSTLHKRGFEQMVADFIRALKTDSSPNIAARDALLTHELCEQIVVRLTGL
jgi:virulence factor